MATSSTPSPSGKSSSGRPLAAKGGIRAQTKSRKVGKNWWTKRWMALLEGFYMGAELPRGRAYAQAGQVLTIDIAHGEVRSRVQGTKEEPFEVVIRFKPEAKTKWKKLTKGLASEAFYTAKLLSGDMPEAIEDLFEDCGLTLFPKDLNDLETSCSNHNGETPCRCVVAVYYLLAEEFDRDPFLFMTLRGLDRQKLIDSIGSTAKARKSKKKPDWLISDFAESPLDQEASLDPDFETFWNGDPAGEKLLGEVRVPPTAGALSKHLGHFPMWRGEERFLDALETVYKKASPNGMDVFLGDW